ncbi:MAG: mannose-1-phosphate guanylyltransferase/mannose-6-phosphate isomerase [Pseudomonadales bacterium]|nr:mannose-1-phosphate guanylyltransferase/mannose-6-phosphate isomerase [Pseudomonadales bacterium]
MLYPVILAGGVGSRLWPLSRAAQPKQFTCFPGQQYSLFQATLQRLEGLPDLADPIVVCNAEHRFLVAEQLRQLGLSSAHIMLEPVGRNTAPAVAMAAHWAQQQDAAAQLLVLPADHAIRDTTVFQSAVKSAAELAAGGKLLTFGIVPGSPETGYGYIKRGESLADENAFEVARFVEKPDLETAKSYLASGDYLWNSGMFLFRASDFLDELGSHAEDIASACHQAFAGLVSDEDFLRLPEAEFAACRSDSIDYAVMEKTGRAAVLPLDAGWSDLGAWDALWEAAEADAQGNVFSGDVLASEVENSYIQAGSRLVAAVGLKDSIVVETADAVLVADRHQAQAVKKIVEQLQQQSRPETEFHTLVQRPWGSFENLGSGKGYQVKHIIVHPGAALSLQMHHHRAEHWTVIRGTARVQVGDQEYDLHGNESIFIPLGSKHRLANNTDEPVEIVEVQIGDYLGEDDIVRFEDRYGRTS